ncbi:MAG TPA: anthranilate synthase component I, partial [Planctomycetaceae bacterium]|nr:anthranilate synthase component I [Planctomycetaceae bacterium]
MRHQPREAFRMVHLPDFEEFRRHAEPGRLVPVYRQLVSDTLTPVSAYCKIPWGPCSFLFESVVGGEKIGRYSFLGSDPFLQIEAWGREIVVTRDGQSRRSEVADPLAELEALLADYRAVHLPGLPRFCGGAVGYAGYDVVRYTERLPGAPPDDRRL